MATGMFARRLRRTCSGRGPATGTPGRARETAKAASLPDGRSVTPWCRAGRPGGRCLRTAAQPPASRHESRAAPANRAESCSQARCSTVAANQWVSGAPCPSVPNSRRSTGARSSSRSSRSAVVAGLNRFTSENSAHRLACTSVEVGELLVPRVAGMDEHDVRGRALGRAQHVVEQDAGSRRPGGSPSRRSRCGPGSAGPGRRTARTSAAAGSRAAASARRRTGSRSSASTERNASSRGDGRVDGQAGAVGEHGLQPGRAGGRAVGDEQSATACLDRARRRRPVRAAGRSPLRSAAAATSARRPARAYAPTSSGASGGQPAVEQHPRDARRRRTAAARSAGQSRAAASRARRARRPAAQPSSRPADRAASRASAGAAPPPRAARRRLADRQRQRAEVQRLRRERERVGVVVEERGSRHRTSGAALPGAGPASSPAASSPPSSPRIEPIRSIACRVAGAQRRARR